ncbi:LysR family transcriptional regulator [Pusillimonas sp. SM2304]|uniref:LysR family transcriptional regulator n=1 Tax=Pusillimonas sp. SM2304 TaxID=3073241 RepID=UPI002875F490|nr:LysR family transcriptional regulator [Pusillimonas sp. SM2304]MDS1141256.1 LysR family transcriptional regulator [Pusillimonas sp. SM2304]
MKIDATTVQLVLAISEEGSISRAADKLNLAVAAASRRISGLERQLGTKLFMRVSHGVRLTESGQKLLQHIRQIDNLVHRLQDDAQAISQGREGRVVIGAPKTVVIQFLARDIAFIQQRYPGITVQVIEENSKIVQQLLRDKVIDVGIYEKKSGFLDLARYDYRQDQLVLVYSRSHFSFPSEPVPLGDLLDAPLIALGKGSAILAAVQRAYRSRGRLFQNKFAVSGFDTMLALVRHGLGVGLMPPGVLHGFHLDPALATAQIQGDWHERSYMLSAIDTHVQQQALHNVVQALIGPQA